MKKTVSNLLYFIGLGLIFISGCGIGKTYYSRENIQQQKQDQYINQFEWVEIPKDSTTWRILINPTIMVYDTVTQKARYYRIKIK